MAYRSGFFNSVDSDRLYNADDMSEYFEGLVSDGVYETVDNAMVVTAGGGMSVNIGTGRAIINCKWVKNESILNLTISAASSLADRTDLVAIKLDTSAAVRAISIVVLNNTSSVPAETDTVKYLGLAKVTVPANATAVSQSNIEDLRGTTACPYVTGLVKQVSTSTLFLQFKSAFDEFMASLKDDLRVDTYLDSIKKTIYVTDASGEYDTGISTSTFKTNEATILVYVNGIHVPSLDTSSTTPAVQGDDYYAFLYSKSSTSTYAVGFAKSSGIKNLNVGDRIDLVVLESKLGEIVS